MQRVECDEPGAERASSGAAERGEAHALCAPVTDSETPVPLSDADSDATGPARNAEEEEESPPAVRTARWGAIIAPSDCASAGPPAPVVAPPLDAPAAPSSPRAAALEFAPSSAPSSRLGGEPWTVHPPPSRPACELLVLDDFPAPPTAAAAADAEAAPTEPAPRDVALTADAVTPVSPGTPESERPSRSSRPEERAARSSLERGSGVASEHSAPVLVSDRPARASSARPLFSSARGRRTGAVAVTVAALGAAFGVTHFIARRTPEVGPATAQVNSLRDPASAAGAIVAQNSASASAPSATAAESVSAAAAAPSASQEPPPPKRQAHSFNTRVADILLNKASTRSRVCKKGASGRALVTVTFAPSGYTTAASVSGLDGASPATATCIRRTFRGLRVPRFSGDPVTVTRTVTLE